MGIERNRPGKSDQGPAASAPDTEDGLYPDTDGDLGHQSDGDTTPLPNSNEPHTSGVDTAVSTSKPVAEDPPLEDSDLADEGRPTGADF